MNQPCPCQSSNPLVRDGTSQAARAQPALDPAHAPVDGRDTAAYLEYLRRYAKILQYYYLSNMREGDWAPFIERDVSSAAAAVSSLNAERQQELLRKLAAEVTRPTGGLDAFRRLLDGLFTLALRMDGWAAIGTRELSFSEVLRQEINGGLRADLKLLIGIYEAAKEAKLLVAAPPGTEVTAEQVLAAGLSTDWLPPGTKSWDDFKKSVPANHSAFGAATLPQPERLARALEYLRALVKSFPRALARMAEAASRDLNKTLTAWPKHEPTMALVLTFLHLFRYALDSLNGLTARHLEYYLREVLRLRPHGAEADRVFLTFTLARNHESAVVPAGTVLLGGKDDQGLPLRYALERDLRVDRTTVGPFMAVHRSTQGVLTASPAANSADGLGAELPANQPGWPAFGSATHPAAAPGFALASPVLLLAEGERTITVKLTLSNTSGTVEFLRGLDPLQLFRVELSTLKGWATPQVHEAQLTDGVLTLSLRLNMGDVPITRYQRAVHGGSMETEWPVCRFFLVQDEARGRTYGALSSLMLLGASVDVQVTGARKLQVETDIGSADPTKPFHPFGAQPLPGSSFTVRCDELAPKRLSSLAMELRWMDPAPGVDLAEIYSQYVLEPFELPGFVDKDTFKVELDLGTASNPGSMTGRTHSGALFEPETFRIPAALLLGGATYRPVDTVRVRLTAPPYGFGHRIFPRLQAHVVTEISRGVTPPPELPHSPVTPMLAGIALTYEASADFVAGTGEDRFFHLHPFGETREVLGAKTPWLPSYPNEGELYVGLGSTGTQRRISLLFQMEEGSGDDLLDSAKVTWSYLDASQRFHTLPAEALGDGTQGLVRSGLVSVLLPSTATDAGGRMPAGQFWLRATTPANTAATCRLIAVHANAASAVLQDVEQHPTHLSRALPPSTITKLEQRHAGIQKIHQPVASFGGRASETLLAFSRRASERLRHKRRAITPHDYETLVLDAFPSLYKVKCLNHTRLDAPLDRKSAPRAREIVPGSVTVVTVPNLIGQTGHNPFTPTTSHATLAAVAEFLQPLVGRFVKLHVTNPSYEPIRLAFAVKFKRGHDDPALSIARLKQEIKALLSPWAFEQGKDIVFGGAIYRSSLLHFVEQRPYVDYVTGFRVFHGGGESLSDDDRSESLSDDGRIVARTALSILVSDTDHDIDPEPIKGAP
jgi:hypothetical protein